MTPAELADRARQRFAGRAAAGDRVDIVRTETCDRLAKRSARQPKALMVAVRQMRIARGGHVERMPPGLFRLVMALAERSADNPGEPFGTEEARRLLFGEARPRREAFLVRHAEIRARRALVALGYVTRLDEAGLMAAPAPAAECGKTRACMRRQNC